MTAKVLIVDDIPANIKLLEDRLMAEYFEVTTAMSGMEALAICQNTPCDIILLDVMMPEMDGFEVCRRIKANPQLAHIPVVMITALDQTSDRIKGLEAGADDFLTKPVNDVALITRVRSLVRLKTLTDEFRMRNLTGRDIGLENMDASFQDIPDSGGRILLVDDRESSYVRIAKILGRIHSVEVQSNPQEALFCAADGNYDLVIVSLGLKNYDGLRLCSQLRSLDRTRFVPVLIITDPEDDARLLRGLDLGVNDYLVRPIDPNEIKARVRTQIRRKRYTDQLRTNVQHTMEMAIMDSLTGLNNRHFLESHLSTLVDRALVRGKPLSLLIMDIDYFKQVNDTWGHDVGDEVLREFAMRLKRNLRGANLVCRYGGEEFVSVMPETDVDIAYAIADRLRGKVADEAFTVERGRRKIDITVSIGIGTVETPFDTPELLLKRADQALYQAKRTGRNRVVADAA